MVGNVPDPLQVPATVLPAEGRVICQLVGTGAGDDSPSGCCGMLCTCCLPAGLLMKWVLVLAAALERPLELTLLQFGSRLYLCTIFGTCTCS